MAHGRGPQRGMKRVLPSGIVVRSRARQETVTRLVSSSPRVNVVRTLAAHPC